MDRLRITLKAARVNAGLTQDMVCDKLGISDRTLSKWESGKSTPSYLALLGLCSIYGLTEDDIILPCESAKNESLKAQE